jgi:hypothetical protein
MQHGSCWAYGTSVPGRQAHWMMQACHHGAAPGWVAAVVTVVCVAVMVPVVAGLAAATVKRRVRVPRWRRA